jgi:flavin-dependent dehydrogenase
VSQEAFDVVIVGAGPSGATAAVILGRSGRTVALIDRARFPRAAPCAGWVSVRVAALLKQIGVAAGPLLDCPFHKVTFHRPDFSKSASPQAKQPFGYLVDRAGFDDLLVKAAVKKGTRLLEGCAVENVELREDGVRLVLSEGGPIEGRLLLLAAGRGTPLLDRVGLDNSESGIWTLHVEASVRGKANAADPSVGVVLGLDTRGSFGLICRAPARLSVGVHWYGDKNDARQALRELCQRAHSANEVALDLSGKVDAAPLLRSPAAAALDMESHVGKHTLVIGDAGGFVSASSNEGVYPAMWSARIAAEVVEKALSAKRSQDELITFDSAWRMEMADYLRSPHSDIQFLLPLIFTNQPMADRMGAAFFLGENI